MPHYFLDPKHYSWKNALLWGNFAEHCKKTVTGNLGDRIIHALIAGLEILPILGQIASIFEKSIVDRHIFLANRSKKILARALTSTTIKALYERANATSTSYNPPSPFTIQLVNKTCSGFKAECHAKERKISIQSSLSDDETISFLAFELTNGISSPQYEALHTQALYGQVECEEYAKQAEHIEYLGTRLHHEVMLVAIKELNLSEKSDFYKNNPETFEEYWNTIKNSSHTNYYRKNWKKIDLWRNRKNIFEVIVNFLQSFAKKISTVGAERVPSLQLYTS